MENFGKAQTNDKIPEYIVGRPTAVNTHVLAVLLPTQFFVIKPQKQQGWLDSLSPATSGETRIELWAPSFGLAQP